MYVLEFHFCYFSAIHTTAKAPLEFGLKTKLS